jgi:hypothetical protein
VSVEPGDPERRERLLRTIRRVEAEPALLGVGVRAR